MVPKVATGKEIGGQSEETGRRGVRGFVWPNTLKEETDPWEHWAHCVLGSSKFQLQIICSLSEEI